MKKFICILVVLIAGYAVADQGFVNLQNITQSSNIKKGSRFAKVTGISGPITLKANAECAVFVNATTLSHSLTKPGYPINTTASTFNVNKTSTLGFTCTSTAANTSYVYVVR
jgi:hypothetical protein